jgi:thiamine biosynthesis protein ThiS
MKAKLATIRANGVSRKIAVPCSLADFLVSAGWRATQVVVEFNGQVVPRNQFGQVQIRDGDQVEVIVPVAGG